MEVATPAHGGGQRQIGPFGTAVRVVLGILLLVFGALGARIILVHGVPRLELDWGALAVGLVGFPAVIVAFQWARSRRSESRLMQTGPLAAVINVIVTLGLVIVTIYFVPAVSFLGTGALVFYGASMLLAALRGYAGCEVFAVSNWLLHRDDQVGCIWLSPVDLLERRLTPGS